jgi:selenocysteine lyase/cysteine desulfurase
MNSGRRQFIQRAALGAAGLAAGASARGAETLAPLPAFDAEAPEAFWRAVRAQFPLSRGIAYFNTGGLGPASQPVLATAAEITRQLQDVSEHGHERIAGARVTVAQFLGVDAGELAFVRNATEGNAIIAAGLALQPGDEVIFESHAHPGGAFPGSTRRNCAA